MSRSSWNGFQAAGLARFGVGEAAEGGVFVLLFAGAAAALAMPAMCLVAPIPSNIPRAKNATLPRTSVDLFVPELPDGCAATPVVFDGLAAAVSAFVDCPPWMEFVSGD